MALCLPQTGAMTAEQYETASNVVAVSSVSSTVSALGEITDFAQISTILWHNSLPANTMVIGMFSIDAIDFDDGGDIIGVHEY